MSDYDRDPGGRHAERGTLLAEEIRAEKYDDPHAGLRQDRVDRGLLPKPRTVDRDTPDVAARRLFLAVAATSRGSLAWRALPAAYRDLDPDEAARQLAALDASEDDHGLAVAA